MRRAGRRVEEVAEVHPDEADERRQARVESTSILLKLSVTMPRADRRDDDRRGDQRDAEDAHRGDDRRREHEREDRVEQCRMRTP